MKQKLISFILISSVSTSILLSPSISVKASTLDNNKRNIEETKLSSPNNVNIIETIENNYLKQNSDGTFYILNDAYNKFDKEIINDLKNGMNGINEYIRNGNLKFKISNENNETKVINTYEKMENSTIQSRAAITIGKIVSNYNYCSNYKWYWWGYKTNVNARGSALLRNNFVADMAVVGGGATLLSVLCPPAAAVIGGLGFIGAVRYADVILQCSNGADSGKGVQVTGWGKPSAGGVFGVKAYY